MLVTWDQPDRWEMLIGVRKLLLGDEDGGLDVLVCEGFTINMGTAKKSTAGSLETIELLGTLRWLAHMAEVPFVVQMPSDASNFDAKGGKLKRLGWWTRGSDHARSATKHLVLYLVNEGLIDPKRLLPSDA